MGVNQTRKIQRCRWGWLSGLSFSLLSLVNPGVAAERVQVTYFVLQQSIPVSALEIYAKEGRLTPDLAVYAQYLKPEQLNQLRSALQERIELDPTTISQFLYTPIGERLLQQVSEVVQAESGASGIYALRSALILAAADPEGLTALSLLRNFPDAGVRLDLAKGIEIFDDIQQLVRQTNRAIAAVQQQAETETKTLAKPAPAAIEFATKPGGFPWQQVTLQLKDTRPLRAQLVGPPQNFPVDLYLPKLARPQPRPVIVISHGLGSNRLTYAYLAQHLASHGFVVAVPEHPGSSGTQLQALFNGVASDVASPQEFVVRPLDIQFLLDELERRGQTEASLRGRLALEQVAVIGQSFGGYTALALAGAKLNLENLRQECGPRLEDSLNISLLLQCQALTLPQRDYPLADPRVKAAIAINPIGSGVFGQTGLSQVKIPVMLVASSADTVAPPLLEQIQPFTWLTTPNRYLVLMENATHFSTTGETPGTAPTFAIPAGLIGPTPALARSYLNALSLAFVQTHLSLPEVTPLTPGAIARLSREPIPLSITQTFTAAELAPSFQGQPVNSTPDGKL